MAQVSIRINDQLKEQADSLFSQLGMSLSGAINVFLTQSVMHGGLPFAVTLRETDPFYSEANQAWLREGDKQLAEGRVKTFTMDEIDAMFKKALGEDYYEC
jgi:DNA-damage-inducible protein J